jgi:hypothetical protein
MPLKLKNKNKPKVFFFGACDLWESLNIDIIRKDFAIDRLSYPYLEYQDSLDFEKCLRSAWAPSVISLYTSPGPIAIRVHETLSKEQNLLFYHYDAYKEILKFPFLKFFKENAGPNDMLVISFSTELYTKIYAGQERFTVLPAMSPLEDSSESLNWLKKEYFLKEEFQVSFDNEDTMNETWDILPDFSRDIHEIFDNRVVLVRTHLTNLGITDENFNIKQVKISCENNIPYYKPTKIITDTRDYTYAQRVTDLVIHQFRRFYKSDVPLVSLKEPFFIDLAHHWGYAPFHLHRISNYKIGQLIYSELVNIQNRIKNVRQH